MEQKQPVRCEKCDREFSPEEAIEYPGKVHVYQGKVMCEDCLVDMGVSPDDAEPYWTYVSARHDMDMGI